MKTIIAILCVVAMVTNVYVYSTEEEPEWVNQDGNGNGGEISDDLKVNVPDHKLRDIAPYDYSVLIC